MKFGPPKQYPQVIIVPMPAELKEEFKAKAGHRNMSDIVRELIREWMKGVAK